MKNNKIIYIVVVLLLLILAFGSSFGWFKGIISGNEEANDHYVQVGSLKLSYIDNAYVKLDNALPGDSFEKVVSVKNSGTLDANYNLIWEEFRSTVVKDELVIEGTCKRINSSGVEEGTCEGLNQVVISSLVLKNNVLIEGGYTHEYTLKVTFIDTGELQDYNKKKSFNGRIGIEEYKSTPFKEDSWDTIVTNIRVGNTDRYNIGDIREIDFGRYGIQKIRIANMSTPSECSTEGFSQSACGFVLEFTNILSMRNMNSSDLNKGGWPGSEAYTFLNAYLYGELEDDLKKYILDTVVVSGHGSEDTDNFISTDKFYLLSPTEVFSDWIDSTRSNYDAAKTLTRQLDYYQKAGVSLSSHTGSIKYYGTIKEIWTSRSSNSYSESFMYSMHNNGGVNTNTSTKRYDGISPAFRIG